MEKKGQQRKLYCEFLDCGRICETVLAWKLVISRTRVRKEVVRHVQTKRRMGRRRRENDAHSQWSWTSRIPWNECPGERNLWKAQEVKKLSTHFCGYCDTVEVTTSHYYFRQPTQCLRSNSGSVWRVNFVNFWRSYQYTQTCCPGETRFHGCPMTNPHLTNDPVQGRLVARTYAKKKIFQKSFDWSKICSDAGFMETVIPGQYFMTIDEHWNGKIGWFYLMSRVYLTSRWWLVQSKRMEPWQHKDRSCIGGNHQLPPKPGWNWDQDWLVI